MIVSRSILTFLMGKAHLQGYKNSWNIIRIYSTENMKGRDMFCMRAMEAENFLGMMRCKCC